MDNTSFTGKKPTITIEYCPKCHWLLRAAYMAQELLTTFEDDLHGVLLHPSEVAGRYSIFVDDNLIFDRKREGRFPEIKELKQLVRDKVNPKKSLGHSDKK
ncbi:MAG: SelT/SelW/SelH family protein [Mucilaginibacter sp.]|uniref:SelT/SelW/SelH family protein n=1 Tax=Mucilaginibacter sp. TaxID=1882438 RepID=UPI0034E3C3E4